MSDPTTAEPDVIVTPEMERAGVEELRDHRLGEDHTYVVATVYMAMEYQRRADAHEKGPSLDRGPPPSVRRVE